MTECRDGSLGNCECHDCRILHVTSPLGCSHGTQPPRGAASSPAGGQLPPPQGAKARGSHQHHRDRQSTAPHAHKHPPGRLPPLRRQPPPQGDGTSRMRSLPVGRPTSTFCPSETQRSPPSARMRQTRGFPGSGDCFRPNHLRDAAEGGVLCKGEPTDGGDGEVPPRRTGPM